MCRPGSVYADCAGSSGLIHYAEAIMLVFSRDSSYNGREKKTDLKITNIYIFNLPIVRKRKTEIKFISFILTQNQLLFLAGKMI